MIPNSIEFLLLQLIRKAEDVNARAVALLAETPGAFKATSHKIPKLNPPELGFVRLASWLYILYFEAGRVNRLYLEKLLKIYNLSHEEHERHASLIQALRTFLQHNLNIEETHDKEIMSQCNRWFEKTCGTAVPDTSNEWLQCLMALLQESEEYLSALDQCLRQIEKDESRESICSEWRFLRSRNHEPHEFDELIPLVATDIGKEFIDYIAFRKRYYDKWVAQLKLLVSGYDFAREARKLIEDALLKDPTSMLPITGADILNEFGLAPGPKIGILLGQAKRIYEKEPCAKKILLEKLLPFFRNL